MWPRSFLSSARAGMAVGLLSFSLAGAQAATSGMVALGGSIKPVPGMSASGAAPVHAFISRTTLDAAESAAGMNFEVALKMRNFADLQARTSRGELISASEMAAKYDPLPGDYQAVVDWLTSNGFTITRKDDHHMAIFVRGTVSQIRRAMQVNFARVTAKGQEFTSAVSTPMLPSSISSLMVGINGLQPHLRAHPHIRRPNATSGTASYSPAQIAQAYQATGLYNSHITGAGQTIAIVIDTFPSTGDLISFWQTEGINQSIGNIQFVQVVAGTLPLPGGEETLDAEWSSSIAPGAKVRVYAATDLANADLDAAYQQVLTDATNHPELGIHQMSMSFGEGEDQTTNSQVQTDDQFFSELAAAGVTLFASSGDEGSTPGVDGSGNPTETGGLVPSTPASDPFVTGVGGTSLTVDANNNETSETVWNNSIGASGGGTSIYFSRPSWQTGNGVPAGSMRLEPDISASSDPNLGADTIFVGSLSTSGGTSWASPTCAGFCALINQARANAGLPPIGLLGPHIYPLIGTANFRDIISGSNATPNSGGLYPATTGYDEATGIGVPLVQTLAQTLVGTPNLIGLSQQPAMSSVPPTGSATFTATATGSPVSYQWQRMPAASSTWSNLSDGGSYSGSTTATLTVSNATSAMSGDRFQCVVTYAGTGALTAAPTSVLVVETPWAFATLAGNSSASGLVDNTGALAKFNYPTGITVDSGGNLYITDLVNNAIRKVTPGGVVTTPYGSLAGTKGSTNGTGNNALFSSPRDIVFDGSTNLYVADEVNNLIRKINTSTGQVTTVAPSATFNQPRGLALDNLGNLYVADSDNNQIRKIATNGTVSILAGSATGAVGYQDATGTQALFSGPIGLAVDGARNVYVADYGNEVIRKITPGGVVTTLAGQGGVAGYQDGPGATALFNVPRGVTIDGNGNLYVTDSFAPITAPPFEFSGNNILRKITPGGVVSTLAGVAGTAGGVNAIAAPQFYNPCGVALNSRGEIFIAEAGNNVIRSGFVQTLTTFSDWEANNGFSGAAAGLSQPNDQLANLMKYAFNINPNHAISMADYLATPVAGVDTTSNPGTTYLTLTFREITGISGTTVNVETSADLRNWSTVTLSQTAPTSTTYNLQVLNFDPVTNDPILEVKTLQAGARQFIRLNVTTP